VWFWVEDRVFFLRRGDHGGKQHTTLSELRVGDHVLLSAPCLSRGCLIREARWGFSSFR
jgi:hypothetical protein